MNAFVASLNAISFPVGGEPMESSGERLDLAVSAATSECHELKVNHLTNQVSTPSPIKMRIMSTLHEYYAKKTQLSK